MPYPPFPAAPLIWTMRLVKGSTLTHLELDDNQKALNQKINDTQGANFGAGQPMYINKTTNPNDGFLNFRSLVEGPGVTINTVGNDIIISSSGGTAGTGDTHVNNVTYSADTICIYLNDGTEFCINMSGDTPYEYGTGVYSIQPKRDGSFASADYSNVGGGLNNIVSSGGTYSNIAGGDTNIIHGNYGFIGGGKNNLIQSGTTYTSILNGSGNTITANTQSTTILGGDNLIGTRSHTSFMNGLDADTDSGSGQAPFRYHGTWANEGLGRILMDMTGAGDSQWVSSAIFPLMCDDPCPSSGSGVHQIVEGYHSGCTLYMTDCSGTTVTADTCCVTTGPYAWRGGLDSITTTLPLIGQAGENIIDIRAEYSTIQGGLSNRILSGVTFSSILNGSGNTISSTIAWPTSSGFTGNTNVTAAAVLGSIGRTATLSETTYVTGLDALTDGYDGFKKPFTYHGDWANEGNGKVLREIVGNGDARWIHSPFPVVNTGDTCTNVIMSAFTTGNTLTLIDTNGNIYTAFTCSIFAGPYEYGTGLDSIQPILDSPFATSNFSSIGGGVNNKVIGVKSRYSRIGGGQNNIINSIGTSSADTASLHSYIGGGDNNTIDESAKSAIVGGESNSITGGTHNIVGGGNNNIINESIKSAIVGGENNLITGGTHNIIGGGEHNIIKPKFTILSGVTVDSTTHSIIGAGKDNLIIGSDNSSIISGSLNLITGGTHNHIGSGTKNTVANSTNTTILNGINNAISGSTTSQVGGGSNNTIINGLASSIVNGISNTNRDSNLSTIGGGGSNILDTVTASTIVVGQDNTIGKSHTSSIVSGLQNIITASTQSIIGAGSNNEILDTSSSSSLISGVGNKVIRSNSAILGSGSANTITHSTNVVLGGGENNLISGETSSSIVGGKDNIILRGTTKDYNIIGGGDGNLITNTTKSVIVAGENNTVTASTHSIVGAGLNNIMNSDSHSTLSSGIDNLILSGDSNILGSGIKNKITSSDRTALMAGSGNTINLSDNSFVGSGELNLIDKSKYSLIVGGEDNLITGGTHNIVGGGSINHITNSYNSSVVSGSQNKITDVSSGIIGGGTRNRINDSDLTIIGAGSQNIIKESSHLSVIGGGKDNEIYQVSSHSIIGGGEDNEILSGSSYSVIVGGNDNKTRWSHHSFIGGGTINENREADYSVVVGGYWNRNYYTKNSFIGGGSGHTINTNANYGTIGGGAFNRISRDTPYATIAGGYHGFIDCLSPYSIIGGGEKNTINSGSTHVGIFNGSGNTIVEDLVATATIGTVNRVGYVTETTFTRGIDANTDGYEGTDRPFRYHGTWANQGFGRILTDMTGLGDAVWMNAGIYQICDDYGNPPCPIVSAWTSDSGCTINFVDCTGTTTTADTCCTITGPYAWRGGIDSITTTLPLAGQPKENKIQGSSKYSTIQGGLSNLIGPSVEFSSILNGSGNTIFSGANYSAIVGSKGRTAVTPETTYVTGLDALTDGHDGLAKPFRYHGAFASNGTTGWVLEAANALGDAVWAPGPGLPDTPSGCTITGATTLGCITTFHTDCSGFTVTADTCDGSYSPYRPAGGTNSITTTLETFGSPNENFVDVLSDYSTISAGWRNKIISGSSWSNILGGDNNIISGASYTAIINGSGNTINHSHSVIMGGDGINTDRISTVFMNGLDVNTNSTTSISGLTQQSFKYHGTLANQGIGRVLTDIDGLGNAVWQDLGFPNFGSGCTLTGITQSAGVITYHLAGSGCTSFTASTGSLNESPYRWNINGANNAIEPILPGNNFADAVSSNIQGGDNNLIQSGSINASILGGQSNKLINDSAWSSIGGGISNTIDESRVSSILGGHQNDILIPGIVNGYGLITAGYQNRVGGNGSYGAIINGSNNIVTGYCGTVINGIDNVVNHTFSAIIGASTKTTDRTFTTFTEGLDVDSNRANGSADGQAFRYHGTWAGPGINRVLTDVDGLGNAVWGRGFVTNDPDCPIVSAFTTNSGCTLNLVDCSGNTITADTCNTFGSISPYEIGLGLDAIQPILPVGVLKNHARGTWTNIGGGVGNSITIPVQTSNIAGGAYNEIVDKTVAALIGGGQSNYIHDSSYSSIVGGVQNIVQQKSTYSAILGGFENVLSGSSESLIGGGRRNDIVKSNTSLIGGGQSNLIAPASTEENGYNIIVGGYDNTVTSTQGYSTIVGGHHNAISGYHTSFIGGGKYNQVFQSASSAIVGGVSNFVKSMQSYNFVGGGSYNVIGDVNIAPQMKHNVIVGGESNLITDIPYQAQQSEDNFIGGGSNNDITGSSLSIIVGGFQNKVYGSTTGGQGGVGTHSIIGGGQYNIIRNSEASMIGSGYGNKITLEEHAFIGGGSNNTVEGPSTWKAFIGAGAGNKIETNQKYSSIVGGMNNRITQLIFSGGSNGWNSILGGDSNTISGTSHSSIVNGKNNLIVDGLGNMDSIAIIGGSNIIADRDNTTFMEGLDVDTNLNTFSRPFRYHGTFASEGTPGHVLTSFNGLGDAYWAALPTGPVTPYSGCPIVSAYTTNTGCTLNLVDCSGRTFSVDTCNTFGALSPYEYRANQSISTVLPNTTVPAVNFIANNQTYSNIQGGTYNSVNTYGNGHNAIGGGWSNAIGGDNTVTAKTGNISYSTIAGGYDNRILGNDTWGDFIGAGNTNHIMNGLQSSIVGGHSNRIAKALRSAILGGNDNTITGGSRTAIINGQNNLVTHQSSVIIGGDSLVSNDTYTTFMNGLNIDSGSMGGNKYFRYHSGLSASGNIGDVLTTVDTLGNAIWMTPCCLSGGTGPSSGSTFDKYCSTDDYIVNVPIAHTHGVGGAKGACGVIINIWDEEGYRVDGEIREINAFQVEVTLSETQNNVKVVII